MKRCRPNLSAFLLLLLFVSAFVLIQMYANVDGDQGVVAVLAREDEIIDQYRLPHLSPINVVIGSKDRNRTQKSMTLFERYHLTDLQMLKPLEEPLPSFKLLIEPNITEDVPQRLSNQKIHSSMIIAIKSAYGNHNRRIAIRESWGGIQFFNGVRMEVVFVLALPESLEDKILANEESFKFGDILLVEMQENYRNVGYKVMASMQWAGDHFSDEWLFCSADDDILPNLPIMFSSLQALILEAENSGRGLPMYCGFGFDESPGVLRSGKWMVPLSEYPYDHYPSICLGGFYSMTVKLTKAIYNASRHYPYFRHDDVFLTGFMRYVVCDSVGDEFHFAKSDPFCGISEIQERCPILEQIQERLATLVAMLMHDHNDHDDRNIATINIDYLNTASISQYRTREEGTRRNWQNRIAAAFEANNGISFRIEYPNQKIGLFTLFSEMNWQSAQT